MSYASCLLSRMTQPHAYSPWPLFTVVDNFAPMMNALDGNGCMPGKHRRCHATSLSAHGCACFLWLPCLSERHVKEHDAHQPAVPCLRRPARQLTLRPGHSTAVFETATPTLASLAGCFNPLKARGGVHTGTQFCLERLRRPWLTQCLDEVLMSLLPMSVVV